jgi:hypothetical protein
MGWCGILMQAEAIQCYSLYKDTTPPQPNHTVTPKHIEPEKYNTWNKSTISRKLLKMDVPTFETCWAVNGEIIKRVTSSWSIFIQICLVYVRLKRMSSCLGLQATVNIKDEISYRNVQVGGSGNNSACLTLISVGTRTIKTGRLRDLPWSHPANAGVVLQLVNDLFLSVPLQVIIYQSSYQQSRKNSPNYRRHRKQDK